MLTHPQFDPVALSLGPLSIHWYGLMYIVAFAGIWRLALYRAHKSPGSWSDEQISDLVFYGAMGAVIGGRLGSVFFYNFDRFLADPIWLFRVWEGGMAFHGGLLGVLAAFGWYSRRLGKPFFETMDFVAPLVPFGLGAGRIGNFIGGELWADLLICLGVWSFPMSMRFRATPLSYTSLRSKASLCSRCSGGFH